MPEGGRLGTPAGPIFKQTTIVELAELVRLGCYCSWRLRMLALPHQQVPASATDQIKYIARCNECGHVHKPGVSVMSQTLLHQGKL